MEKLSTEWEPPKSPITHVTPKTPLIPHDSNLTHDETEDVVEDVVAATLGVESESLGVVHGAGLIIDLLRKAELSQSNEQQANLGWFRGCGCGKRGKAFFR